MQKVDALLNLIVAETNEMGHFEVKESLTLDMVLAESISAAAEICEELADESKRTLGNPDRVPCAEADIAQAAIIGTAEYLAAEIRKMDSFNGFVGIHIEILRKILNRYPLTDEESDQVYKRIREVQEQLASIEARENAPDTRYCYGATCTWHGPIDETAAVASVNIDHSFPACPHCNGPLYECDSKAEWDQRVASYEEAGHPTYRAFSEWLRTQSRCFPNYLAAMAVYRNPDNVKQG